MKINNSTLEVIRSLHPNSLLLDEDLKVMSVFGKSKFLFVKAESYLNKNFSEILRPSICAIFETNLSKAKKKCNEIFSEKLYLKSEEISIDIELNFLFVDSFYMIYFSADKSTPNETILNGLESLESVGGFFYDLETEIMHVQSTLKNLFDLKPGDNLNDMFSSKYFDDNSKNKIQDSLKNLKLEDVFEDEFSITTEDGTTKVIRLKYKAVKGSCDGKISGFSGTVKDITSDNQAGERSRFALSYSDTGYWDWNIKDGDLFFDERMYELYEFNESEITDLYGAWINSLLDEDKDNTEQVLQGAIDGTQEYNLYFRINTPSGLVKSIH